MKVMEPYMSSLFYPFKVKYMFGCTAIHEPVDGVVVRTSNQNFVRAVGDFWFSSWLPDAAAPENSPDTVNILAEADWRAYVQDCYALEQFYEEKGWSIDWEDGPPYPEGHPANSDFWVHQREDKMPTCFPTWLHKTQGILVGVEIAKEQKKNQLTSCSSWVSCKEAVLHPSQGLKQVK